ncbi:MAG: hypothetical protein F6K19_02180 [Cyanothece sp. SIO1E1]|nr:hypothetical protein [Cyanothece sp. SIO1E1]
MIYVILGMHKSGTTLISEILHCSGVNMVDDQDILELSYDAGNKYERDWSRSINHSILDSRGVFSLDIKPPNQERLSSELISGMDQMIASCSQKYDDWGFKDPRTCLTYAFWAMQLPAHKVIVIYRSPEQIWGRYFQDACINKKKPVLGTIKKFIDAWITYNSLILDSIRDNKTPYLILDYEDFITADDDFLYLQKFLGKDLLDKRNMRLYRNRDKSFMLLNIYKNIFFDKKICSINNEFARLKREQTRDLLELSS